MYAFNDINFVLEWFDILFSFLEHGFQRIYYLYCSDLNAISSILYQAKENAEKIDIREKIEEIQNIPNETETVGFFTITKNGLSINIKQTPSEEISIDPKFKSKDGVLSYLRGFLSS